MSELRALVEEMVLIQRAMGEAAHAARQDPVGRPALAAMRKRFAQQVVRISAASDDEPQLIANPDLAAEFGRRFADMRAKIGLHQAKWPAVLIDDSDPEFNSSAQAIIANNRAFAAWALDVLK